MLTPYGAAKIVNARLEEIAKASGRTDIKAVRPQMMYNYTLARINSGDKPFIKYTAENGVDLEDLHRWFNGYATKKGYVVAVEDPEQEAFDLSEAQ